MEPDSIILNYRHRPHGGEWEEVEQKISFSRTPCNYGGYRTWFLCPRCWKRVAVLYGMKKYFLCRHCYDLAYGSQREARHYRLMRKADTIKERLGGKPGRDYPFPWKPKNMHWKTYWHLRQEAEEAENLGWEIVGKRFGILY
ncbi:MAG: hypothetical protein Q8L09_01965 [Candidatus Moranbacteria bacterium]|nr:hypothetical protein [Candidatus Moranbacteria bacterium]